MDLGSIRIRCDGCFAELSFPARHFFRQDVTRECVTAFDFSGRRELEPLGGAFMSF